MNEHLVELTVVSMVAFVFNCIEIMYFVFLCNGEFSPCLPLAFQKLAPAWTLTGSDVQPDL